MTIADLCDGLIYHQRKRQFCIKSQSRCDRSIEAFLASLLGFETPKTKTAAEDAKAAAAARKKLFAQARKIRLGIEKAGEDHDYSALGETMAAVAPMVLMSAAARSAWDRERLEIETDMREIARRLPAWPFVEGVRGFSDLGLAALVGEAGNLSNYATVARLWKRYGLAVTDGQRQGSVPHNTGGDDRKEAWKARGYVARRRAEVYVFCDDLLCRAQWRAEKVDKETGEIIPAHAIGPYGEIYARKKAEYLARPDDIKAPDRAARRYMAKCFIVDLWRAWRAGTVVDAPVDRPWILPPMAEAAE